MTQGQTIIRREFPNGDVAVDEGNGLAYCTPGARYTVELVPPPRGEDPYGVDLVRITRSEHGLEREQRLRLAEYPSHMSAEEHVCQVERTLLERGREGLQTELALVEAMPFEPDTATYLTGIYPPEWSAGRVTLSVIRLEGERMDVAPVAYGSLGQLAAVDRRLEQALAEGGPARLLDVATAEAVQAGILPPGTPLFAPAGEDWGVNRPLTVEGRPEGPGLTVPGLPVTFEDDMTPLNAQGRYVAHHRDAAGTVHFFAVMDRPPEDLTPGDAPRELRYFRAQKTAEGQVIHDSLPVMPVSAPGSPWPIPLFSSLLEDARLEDVQSLAGEVARLHDLPFPDTLPPLGAADPESAPENGWYHYDTALVLAMPQGVDDRFSVGVVDVYRNHESEAWAARYLPMGEFDTLDEALSRERLIMQMRAEERKAVSPPQFRDEPAIYERIARAEADVALADLLEQHDGHLPPDYDGDHEPQWEPLTSKEWEAYRDFVQMIRDADPDIAPAYGTPPTATPRFAGEDLVAGSEQPPLPYRTPDDFAPEVISLPTDLAPTWRLDIVPARDPDGALLGYSAVCVVDFSDLAETLSPEASQRAQWLEVAQFQAEDRAQQFREDFMSLVGADKRSNAIGPALAEGIAGDLGLDGDWQTMDRESLEKLKAGEWGVTHPAEAWQPPLDEVSANRAIGVPTVDLDL
mgnify:CR=1 FL=1